MVRCGVKKIARLTNANILIKVISLQCVLYTLGSKGQSLQGWFDLYLVQFQVIV